MSGRHRSSPRRLIDCHASNENVTTGPVALVCPMSEVSLLLCRLVWTYERRVAVVVPFSVACGAT